MDVAITLEIDDPVANTGHLYTSLRGLDKLVIIIPNTVTLPSNPVRLSSPAGLRNGVRGPQVLVGAYPGSWVCSASLSQQS